MRLLPTVFILVLVSLLPAGANVHEWTSANGKKKMEAEFVKLEGYKLTLRRKKDDKVVTLDLKDLSEADREYAVQLAANGGKPKADKDKFGIFDLVEFGMDRDTVMDALKRSSKVEASISEVFLARTGLNGVYFVEIDGEQYDIFFEWGKLGDLRELTLQSKAYDESTYDKSLKLAWKRLRSAVVKQYGEAGQSSKFPPADSVPESGTMSSDLWKIGKGRYLYLGVGRLKGRLSTILKYGSRAYGTVR